MQYQTLRFFVDYIKKPISLLLTVSIINLIVFSCSKKQTSEPPATNTIEVSQDGSANGTTNEEGEIIINSTQFGELKLTTQDSTDKSLSNIDIYYLEESGKIKVLLSDPSKKYAGTLIWGNPSSFSSQNAKFSRNLETQGVPILIHIILHLVAEVFFEYLNHSAYEEACELIANFWMTDEVYNEIEQKVGVVKTPEQIMEYVRAATDKAIVLINVKKYIRGAVVESSALKFLIRKAASLSFSEGVDLFLEWYKTYKKAGWPDADPNMKFLVKEYTSDINSEEGLVKFLNLSIQPYIPSLSEIQIIPSSTTIHNSQTQQFTCTAHFSDGSTQDVTNQAIWSIFPGTAGSINSGGLFTAHSTNTGTETVTATYQGQIDHTTVTVLTNGPETGTVTDIDGNVYQTVKIGDQWWMAENLKVTHYRNGDPIPNVTDDSTWEGLTTGAFGNYDNDANIAETYGSLYNGYAVDDSRNIAPEGWHVPSDDEWKELEMYLGMNQSEAYNTGWRGTDEGGKLKEAGIVHWFSPNFGATNESGFSALPGGYRRSTGGYSKIGGYAYFRSSTELNNGNTWYRHLDYERSKVYRSNHDDQAGFSVRCVRD